jgi:hypothetical protein
MGCYKENQYDGRKDFEEFGFASFWRRSSGNWLLVGAKPDG